MPRYFFHVRDGRQYDDLQGTTLPNLKAARREAVRFAGALLLDEADAFWDAKEWTMSVNDKAGATLFSLTFFATEATPVTTE